MSLAADFKNTTLILFFANNIYNPQCANSNLQSQQYNFPHRSGDIHKKQTSYEFNCLSTPCQIFQFLG